MALDAIQVLLKTAYHGYRLSRKSDDSKNFIKEIWSNEVLELLGYEFSTKGTPPGAGPCILVGNHISFLDIPVLLRADPSCVFVAKDTIKHWPLFGTTGKAMGTIFVSRSKNKKRETARASIIKCLLEKPKSKIVVFPSGTTSLKETKIWKKGIFEIAKALNIPVQLFRLDYHPLRESAYIEDDNLLLKLTSLSKADRKKASVTWIRKFHEIEDPSNFAENLRQTLLTKIT